MNLLLQSMLEAHPQPSGSNTRIVADAVESLALCQQVCIACADACLSEPDCRHLLACIRLDLDCAAVCGATAATLLRQRDASVAIVHAQLHACVLACQACGDECARHGRHHAHCAICAETCRRSQEKCNVAIGELSPAGLVSNE